jgi:hypothetical protein
VSESGVIPRPEDRRARVAEVGAVQDLAGLPLRVAVSGGNVVIAGHVLDETRMETFAQLWARACWLAGQNAAEEAF